MIARRDRTRSAGWGRWHAPLISIEPGSDLQTFSASSPVGGKIAMFLPSLGGGGAEKSIVRLTAAFDRRGIAVDLVVGTAEGPVRDDVPPGVTLVDLDRPRVATALPGLVRYLRRERPAVLFSAMYHANLVAILAHGLARSSSRLVVSERQSFVALRRAERSYKERLMRGAMRLLYPRADAVITVSKALAVEIADGLGLPAKMIFPVYNPVVSGEMLALADQDPGHPWFGDDVPVIVGAGRLVPEKDFPTLLGAVAHIARRRPVRVILVGEGHSRAELEALADRLGIADRVDLVGRKSNPWSFMKRAAVFVLSSVSEGMPSVLVEAIAVGTPVVSTDCPTGPREILGDGYPLLVPVGDVNALAAAIEATLDRNDLPPQPDIAPFTEAASVAAHRDILLGSGRITSATGPVR